MCYMSSNINEQHLCSRCQLHHRHPRLRSHSTTAIWLASILQFLSNCHLHPTLRNHWRCCKPRPAPPSDSALNPTDGGVLRTAMGWWVNKRWRITTYWTFSLLAKIHHASRRIENYQRRCSSKPLILFKETNKKPKRKKQ